jgi:hypothetical protein
MTDKLMRSTRIISLCTVALSLAACSGIPTGGHDIYGNETPAFGVATSRTIPTLHYLAQTREALITYCHDQHGYISGDGYSCAKSEYRVGSDWCMQATVTHHQGDVEWMSSVCDGWKPSET